MAASLDQLITALATGDVEVIDLTQPLGPETPVIALPPPFAPSPGVTLEVISRYDAAGPAWYWNTIRLGEHTGTHFDAPIHWITGKDLPDGATDTLPPARFVGPACVVDVEAEVAADADFLLDVAALERWEARAWPGATRRLGAVAYGMEPPDRRGLPQRRAPTGPTAPASTPRRRGCWPSTATCSASASRRSAPTPARPAGSIRRSPITASCTATASSDSPALQPDRLPPTGAVLIAAPLKIVGGSGSPVRALALAPRL